MVSPRKLRVSAGTPWVLRILAMRSCIFFVLRTPTETQNLGNFLLQVFHALVDHIKPAVELVENVFLDVDSRSARPLGQIVDHPLQRPGALERVHQGFHGVVSSSPRPSWPPRKFACSRRPIWAESNRRGGNGTCSTGPAAADRRRAWFWRCLQNLRRPSRPCRPSRESHSGPTAAESPRPSRLAGCLPRRPSRRLSGLRWD